MTVIHIGAELDVVDQGKYWYRFVDLMQGSGVVVYLQRWTVERLTSQGAWLTYAGQRRWCSRFSMRFACPTVEHARDSFKRRKRHQARILSGQLSRAEEALRVFEANPPVDII